MPEARPSFAMPEPRIPASFATEPWRARISQRRPMEAILFEQTSAHGATALTALVDRRTGELAFVGQATELSPSELEELRGHARGGGTEGLAPLPLEHARLKLARAILASRIAGRHVPSWLIDRADLVGDPCHPASRVDDVYMCAACDAALPPDEQLARAHRDIAARDATPPRCPACRGVDVAELAPAEAWLARAWLMLAADLPHRALVCAARAEAARASQARLDIVRGLAHLRLEQGSSALACFQRAAASQRGSIDSRLAVWMNRAADLVDRTVPARQPGHRDHTVPAPVPGHTSSRSLAPVPAFA